MQGGTGEAVAAAVEAVEGGVKFYLLQLKRVTIMSWRKTIVAAAVLFLAEPAGAADIGRVFSSPEDAAASLAQAVQAKDMTALKAIFGPASDDLVESSDPVAQKNRMEEFSAAYSEQHKIAEESASRRVLVIGKNGWPFPIPLAKEGAGWFFDTQAGREEVLNRRIGENELNAVAVSRAYVDAQNEYVTTEANKPGVPPQFAAKIISSPGTKDGLYWPVGEGEQPSPLGPLVAKAEGEGYSDKTAQPDPYRGYFFRILSAQGKSAPGGQKSYLSSGRMVNGFALIAFPAQWGTSGVMSFVVNQEGTVYEKDLGPETARIARAITEYNPNGTWKPVPENAVP